jgi:hypothetical protein
MISEFAQRAFRSKCDLLGKTCRVRGADHPCIAGPGDDLRELSEGGFSPDGRRTIYISSALEIAVGEHVEVDGKGYYVTEAGDIGPGEQKLVMEADARR